MLSPSKLFLQHMGYPIKQEVACSTAKAVVTKFAQSTEYRLYTAVAEIEDQLLNDDVMQTTSERVEWGFNPLGSVQAADEETEEDKQFKRGLRNHEVLQGVWDRAFSLKDEHGNYRERTPEEGAELLEPAIGYMESFLIYLRQLWICPDIWHFSLATMQFVRAITGKSVLNGFQVIWEKVSALVTDIAADISDHIQSGEQEFENPFTTFRNWITKIDEVKNHPIVQKCRKVFLYILSFSFLERFGISFDTFWFTKAEAEYHKEKHTNGYGFFYSVLDGTTYILERLYDCHKTGTWSALVHSSTSYSRWADAVYSLKVDAIKLHNPEANGLSYHEYLARLDNAIEQGRAICKFMVSEDPKAKMVAKKLLSELEMIKATECTKKAARQARDSPFSVLLFAGSSVGKSTLTSLTFQHFGKVHGLPTDSEYHYSRTFSDEFYSGFTTSMWSINLDDVASRNPNLGEDASMDDIIQIINNVPFTPPQADLADKGKTPMRAALVQATTNTKDLNAQAYYANTLAIQRRFPYVVTVTIKAEYAILVDGVVPEPQCRMLDSSKTPPLKDGEYPDYWDFQIENVKANVSTAGGQFASFVPADLSHTSSIYEYLAYISRESLKHKRNQEIMRESAAQFAKVEICKTCFMPSVRCTCEQVQTSEFLIGGALSLVGGLAAYAGASKVTRYCKEKASDIAVEILADTAETIARRLRPQPTEVVYTESDDEEEFFDAPTDTLPCIDYLRDLRNSLRDGSLTILERLERERANVSELMSAAGKRAQSCSIGSKALLAFLAAMPVIIAGYKMYTMYNALNVQGVEASDPRSFRKDETENPWYRDDYAPSAWELGPLTKSWKSLPTEQVIERVQRQTMFATAAYINSKGENARRTFRMVCLTGQLYATNNHNLPEVDMSLTVTPSVVSAGIGDRFTMKLFERDIYRCPASDMAFFVIKCVPPRGDISGLLCDKTFRTKCGGVLLSRSETGEAVQYTLSAMQPQREAAHELGDIECFRGTSSVKTDTGDCGSAYLGFSPVGPVLLGLHLLGGHTQAVACARLTREDFELAKARLAYIPIVAGVPNLTEVDGTPCNIGPLHPKSTFRYIEEGNADVYGSFQGFRAANKSKVTKTLIHQKMVDAGYKVKVGAPVMKSYQPWRHAHKDIVQQKFVIEQSRLNDCVEAFVEDIKAGLSPDDFAEMKILDDMATVNGLPGVKYIDKMNRSTSMGFPWRHSKRQELEELGEFDIWSDAVDFSPEFHARVGDLIAKYKRGERAMPVFIEHLKDEVLPLRKILDQKTRVFSGCPADFAFVVRKYLLATVRVIQKNRFVFECAPGTNATSLEWCEIRHYLTKHGLGRLIAGDYSKFDKKMNAIMILAAFDVLYRILKHAGWTDENLLVIVAMGFDIAFPLVDANGDVVQFWGSNPSGHPLTVIINSIVNSLYVRYAWSLVGNDLKLFKLLVALMTYGDDNTMGVSERVNNFDHTVLQRELAKIGVVYTMADKEAESVPFLHIDQISFLKRTWTYLPEVGSHVAKLEHDSIEKGLLYHIPSKVVCREQQAVDVMGNALREYFYYGRETFDERRKLFEDVVKQEQLQDYFEGFPTFDGLAEQYLEDNKRYSPDGRCVACSA